MKKNEIFQRPTLLTRKDLTVVEILNEKAKATSPELAVDYVEYTDTLITRELNQIKQAKKELSFIEANLKSEQERIKIGTAQWLDSLGVDALNGLRVSSISAYTPKSTENITVINENFFLDMGFKKIVISVDMTKAKAWINKQIEDFDIDVLSTTFKNDFTYEIINKEPMAKINRRKS